MHWSVWSQQSEAEVHFSNSFEQPPPMLSQVGGIPSCERQ